jgi:hypothetical protein
LTIKSKYNCAGVFSILLSLRVIIINQQSIYDGSLVLRKI